MVTEEGSKYLDKITQLCGNGWKKDNKGRWEDPITGDSHLSLVGAWKRHLKYKEKYGE